MVRVVAKERQVPVALGGANQMEADAQGCARVIVLCLLQVHDTCEQRVCFIRSQSGEFQNPSNVGNVHGYWPPKLYPSNPRNPAFPREPAETGQFTRALGSCSAPWVSRCGLCYSFLHHMIWKSCEERNLSTRRSESTIVSGDIWSRARLY